MRFIFISLMLLFSISLYAGMDEAKKFYANNQLDEAINELNNVLKENGYNKDALNLLMNIYRKKNNVSLYIKTAKKYIHSGGTLDFDATWSIANTAHEMKDHENALFFAKYCNTLSPNNSSIYNLIGVAYFYLKKYKLSIIALKAAVYYNGNESIYLANLARSYEISEDYAKAFEYYKLSLKKDPNFKRAAMSLQRVEGLLQSKRQN